MIPNYLSDVHAAKAKYSQAWAHAHVHDDPQRYDFIKLLAKDLHAKDPRVANNGKRGNPNDLSMDAVNILDPDDGPGRTPEGWRCWVVDVIAGAGGANPQPTWQAFTDPIASTGAWVKPSDAPVPPPIPLPPVQKTYPGDLYFIEQVGMPLEADYTAAGQRLNAGSATWFARTIFDAITGALTMDASVAKHRAEWRAALGLPPIP